MFSVATFFFSQTAKFKVLSENRNLNRDLLLTNFSLQLLAEVSILNQVSVHKSQGKLACTCVLFFQPLGLSFKARSYPQLKKID